MKIAIVADVLINSGGGLHMAMTAFNNFRKINNPNFEIVFVSTNKDLSVLLSKKLNLKTTLFDKNDILNKILLKLHNFSFVNYLSIKYDFHNIFEKFLKKNKIDLIFFLSPSSLVSLCDKTNFIYTIWEFQHKFTPFFPEYKSNSIENKDALNDFAIKKAFKLILGNNTDLNNFSKIYNVNPERLRTLMFPSYLTQIKNENNLDQIDFEFQEKINKKKFLFYPAQFWAHKNHEYIINSFEKIDDKNLYCIFTGIDKGNLNFIKKLIDKKKLNEKFIIFNYLSNEKIQYLYNKCYAVLFPSYVGSHSFPLFEGFYYKKPVIYNKYTIDEDLKNMVFQIDIEDKNDLNNILKSFISNKSGIINKVDKAKTYFEEKFNTKAIQDNIEKVLIEYEKFQKKWKD